MKERLIAFLAYLDMGQTKFEEYVGLSRGFVNKLTGNMTMRTLSRIASAYPELNLDWLQTGTGTMLRTGMTSANSTTDDAMLYVPLLPIHAQGGSLDEFVVSVKNSDCEKIVSPIKGADFAINVSGESMYPEYPSGSQILIKRINERAFIDWGKTYVLDTCNGTVIKRIVPSARAGYIRCVSINPAPEYAPFEVSLDDIYGIYRVLMCMATK